MSRPPRDLRTGTGLAIAAIVHAAQPEKVTRGVREHDPDRAPRARSMKTQGRRGIVRSQVDIKLWTGTGPSVEQARPAVLPRMWRGESTHRRTAGASRRQSS